MLNLIKKRGLKQFSKKLNKNEIKSINFYIKIATLIKF